MAKKSKQSLEESIDIFKNVMERSSLSDYLHVNRVLISKNQKDNSVLVTLDPVIWNNIIDDNDFKNKIRELDLKNPDDEQYSKIYSYAIDVNNNDSWIELDCDKLYSGKIVKIKLDNFEYEISINKSLLPLKLRKSEFNNITYKIFDDMTLALNKRFNYPIEGCGFNVIRIFQII